jgi:hypothetical protein
MRWLGSLATRLMPVAFLLIAAIAVAQFWLQHAPSSSALDASVSRVTGFLHEHAWWALGIALPLWLLFFMGYFR